MERDRGWLRPLAPWLVLGLLAVPAIAHAEDVDEEEDRDAEDVYLRSTVIDFDCMMLDGSLGATPGGAQDIGWFRDQVRAGQVPHPNTFTPEGLFSEHDLPLDGARRCTQLLCVDGQVTEASLIAQPDVRYLAQLGFTSGLDAATFRRDALNLVAVVDTSGSMDGAPLTTVRESLRDVARRLGPDDQLSIVRYSDRVEVVLPPTPGDREAEIQAAIVTLASAGSTYMEAGLELGYEVARESAPRFDGTTRVMLFTDERPNVGQTDAGTFIGMARAASTDGIGLTTIGVGVHFGAELATAISSVRGGNLFFFPDVGSMEQKFAEEFDTLVTELAYDMDLVFRPAAGYEIAGVYGVPGQALEWGDDGSISMAVETIFLSRRDGALYVALASDTPIGLPEKRARPGSAVVAVDLAYTPRDGARATDRLELAVRGEAGPGLRRGALLVDQVTALKEATRRHHEENDQQGAYELVKALATRYRGDDDPALALERELVFELERTLAEMSGHHGEPTVAAAVHPVTGLPQR